MEMRMQFRVFVLASGLGNMMDFTNNIIIIINAAGILVSLLLALLVLKPKEPVLIMM